MLGAQKLSKSISKNKHTLKLELPRGQMPEAGTSFPASVKSGDTKSGSPEQVLRGAKSSLVPVRQSQIFSGVKQTQRAVSSNLIYPSTEQGYRTTGTNSYTLW